MLTIASIVFLMKFKNQRQNKNSYIIYQMACAQKKMRGRSKKASAWTHVTVFLRIFRARKDFQWSGNEIQCEKEPFAERFGVLRTRQKDKVECLKKKAVGQFAKQFNLAKLECEAVFMRPFFGEMKPMQVDTQLHVEQDREYTLIFYMKD